MDQDVHVSISLTQLSLDQIPAAMAFIGETGSLVTTDRHAELLQRRSAGRARFVILATFCAAAL
jgi:hypothetical protein